MTEQTYTVELTESQRTKVLNAMHDKWDRDLSNGEHERAQEYMAVVEKMREVAE